MKNRIVLLFLLSVLLLLNACADDERDVQEEEDYPRPQRELPDISP